MTTPSSPHSRTATLPARLWRWLNDRVLISLARLTLRIFFRQIEVVGAERIPRDRPLVIVANHFNGLIDPLLLAFLPLRPRFLAKSTLWSNPVVRPLLAMSSAVPVYRRQDSGVDTSRNAETFDECHRRLAEGETVALFPEGKSHSEAALAPMKTGAARIVLEAMARYPELAVAVVPVGLNFDDKGTFRSRVLIEVGEPIEANGERELHAADSRAAVRKLTERIGTGLKAVTLNHASHADARLVERTAELYLRSERGVPVTLAETFAARRAIAAGYERMRYRERLGLEAFRAALDQYERILHSLVLEDRHVVEPASARPLLKALFVMLLAPLALIGLALNWLPYHLAGRIAQRVEDSPDLPATYKLFSGFILLPLTWLLAAAFTYWAAGAPLAVSVLLLGPLTGYVLLRFSERVAACWTDIRAYVLLRAHDGLLAVLRAQREAAETHLTQLIAAYSSTQVPAVAARG